MSRFTPFFLGKILDARKIAGVKNMTHIMYQFVCMKSIEEGMPERTLSDIKYHS